MKNKISIITLVIVFAAIIISCKKEHIPENSRKVVLTLPEKTYEYNSNASDAEVTLGRVLFYDNSLSINNSISCGSCHRQSLAFSDDVAFSKGFENRLTGRNTPPIQNLSGGFFDFQQIPLFWDGRETFLPSMVLKPIVNHVEMGMSDLNKIVEKVKGQSYYSELFMDAFNSDQIDIQKISSALASFTGAIRTTETNFDKSEGNLTGLAAIGEGLFVEKYECNSCHQIQDPHGYLFGGGFLNIGLDANPADIGVAGITKNPEDVGKFKVPSLRNVAVTAPYMHDGRFKDLDDVLDHYSLGIANSTNLDPRLKDKNNQPIRLNINAQEKKAIIAFLGTLTDYKMLTAIEFSDPFKKIN